MGTSDPFEGFHYRCAVGTSTVTPGLIATLGPWGLFNFLYRSDA
jgi:hypothetical protein